MSQSLSSQVKAVSERSNSSSRLRTIDKVSQVIADSHVLVSTERMWDDIDIVHFRHTLKEIAAPAFSSHLVLITLEPSIHLTEKIDGHVYEKCLNTGDVTIVPAGLSSEWCWTGQEEAENLQIYLKPTLLSKVAVEADDANPDRIEIVNHLGVCDPQVQHIGLALKAELETGCVAGRLYSESLSIALAVHLLKKYSVSKPLIRKYSSGIPQHKLRLIIEFIQDNLDRKITLAEISVSVGMNPYHLTRTFKQTTGISPHQYLMRSRIERAQILLTKSNLPIVEISQQVGFEDQSHFTKVFRKLTGVTPKAYRNLS